MCDAYDVLLDHVAMWYDPESGQRMLTAEPYQVLASAFGQFVNDCALLDLEVEWSDDSPYAPGRTTLIIVRRTTASAAPIGMIEFGAAVDDRVRSPRNISPAQRARIFERDGFTCRRCGAKAPGVQIVVDHIVPVARGGNADDANLQTLCVPCNQGKADRAPCAQDLRPFEPEP